ncbi:NADPH-dependent FMN reductase [Thauera linaloolentis]|uniref:NADPH-dependent FMN reductase n=1 Tax=Thauera linaloolentis (strain DSM 12138 / JCM 21573 / CCUG 41526 / CIP 105981 / IAM 15112 / NBRC 102519 / 47Lol) TaxID=1123367 RepID=N6YRZ4_THAL4|nr:NAD(P)H-dependent oxidoreductase [Thauera linaloolentis]ENO84943.1 NADPH-dependent FMN reductase [Thauera linaloolentis 47Lol = DSM 12138]MCM8566782.1 NAD(P)H-dependent oxidoreductase [Thauera linaloolentis]
MRTPRIVVMAGSSRRDALSRRIAAACAGPLQAAGADVKLVELADYPAPLYNGDLEAESGLPPGIVELQQVLHACDGLLVVNPEYNGSITPLLKNTLDWCSRPNAADGARSGGAVYAGRAAAVIGTSPGALGGMRVLFHVRDILGYLGMQVIPQQLAIGHADNALGEDGRLRNEAQRAALDALAAALADTARRLRG